MTTPTGDRQTGPALTWRAVAGLLRELADGCSVEDLCQRHHGLTIEDLRVVYALLADLLAEETEADLPILTPPPVGHEAATLAPGNLSALPEVTPVGEPGVPRRAVVPGYTILEELGRGGMGVVYKARHLKLNRDVALKMILAGDHASPEMFARFQREAEVVAALQHPNIVQIYEVGEHEGHPYLALEFVPGGSLAARLTDEPWPAEKAAALVEKLARAVHEAHRRNIVHRDLKPENVLLTEEGAPKLTDFGLAKRLDDGTGRTRTGELMGTPAYMAPEQAAGRKKIGPAADVHALGAILYRLLAGRPPFEGRTTLDVLMGVLDAEPQPLSQVNPSIPPDLAMITAQCLEKEPDWRYRNAARLADDLRRFLRGEPIKARSSWLWQNWRSASHSPIKRALWVVLSVSLTTIALSTIAFGNGLGLAAFLAAALLTHSLLKANGRHLGLGALAGVVLAGGLAVLIAAWPELVDRHLQRAFGIKYARDWTNWKHLLIWPSLLGLPLFVAVATGAFFAERWRNLLIGLLLLGGLTMLAYPFGLVVPLIGAAAGFYWGGLTRLISRQFGGDVNDVLLGAVLGGVIGGIVCCGVGLLPGSAIGAGIGVRYSRKPPGPLEREE